MAENAPQATTGGPSPSTRPTTGYAVAAILIIAGVVAGIGVAVSSWVQPGGATRTRSRSVGRVLSNTAALTGERVAVNGEVKRKLGNHALLLGGSKAARVGLLVVPRNGTVPPSVRRLSRVRVVGTVRRFSLERFRVRHPDVSPSQLERSPLFDLQGHPTIEATSIRAA